MHSSLYQLELLLKLLTSPVGLLSLAAILLLLTLTLIIPKMKWIVLAMMLCASTLVVGDFVGRQALIFPLEQLSTQGRGITIALLLVTIVGCLMSPRGWRHQYFVPGLLFFFIFEIVIGINLALRSEFSHGAGGIVLFMIQFFLF